MSLTNIDIYLLINYLNSTSLIKMKAYISNPIFKWHHISLWDVIKNIHIAYIKTYIGIYFTNSIMLYIIFLIMFFCLYTPIANCERIALIPSIFCLLCIHAAWSWLKYEWICDSFYINIRYQQIALRYSLVDMGLTLSVVCDGHKYI